MKYKLFQGSRQLLQERVWKNPSRRFIINCFLWGTLNDPFFACFLRYRQGNFLLSFEYERMQAVSKNLQLAFIVLQLIPF
jgi:hypothetical protein